VRRVSTIVALMGEAFMGKDVLSLLDDCHEDPTMAEDMVDFAHIPVPPPAYVPLPSLYKIDYQLK